MGSNESTRPVVLMIAILLLIILMSSGTQAAVSSESSSPPAMARRGGPVPPPTPPPISTIPDPEDDDQNCPDIRVPDLIDACRRPPGPRACAAQWLIYHYRGGICDLTPNGRPGDCFCKNCVADKRRVVGWAGAGRGRRSGGVSMGGGRNHHVDGKDALLF